MQINNDFLMRKLGAVAVQPPMLKDEVTDEVFLNILGKVGQHQKMMDISRCTLLTQSSFELFALCNSLQFLDISHTQISNLSCLVENCLLLRSLCLSGVTLSNTQFQSLSQLHTLEFLTLRSSSIESIDLCKDMIMLRSLDLGETNISSISTISGNRFSRLESLTLDRCCNIGHTDLDIAEFLETIKELPGLILLNVSETVLAQQQWLGYLITNLPSTETCIEARPRRELFLEAIIANDEPFVRCMISYGQIVNFKFGPWAENIMANAWKNRCRSGRLQTPFFMTNHEREVFRPTPVHVALLFASCNVLRILLLNGCESDTQVWFSDVMEVKGNIIIDEKLASQRDRREFMPKELPKIMYDRNVHRLTEKMIEKKITNWKAICLDIMKELEDIINDPAGKKHHLKKHIESDVRPPNAVTNFDGNRNRNSNSNSHDSKDSDINVFPPSASEIDLKNNNVTSNELQQSPLGKILEAETKSTKQDDNFETTDLSNNSSSSSILLVASTTKKKARKKTTNPPQNRPDWRKHSMVSSLIGEPFIVKGTNIKSGMAGSPLLGFKDFWLESRGHTLHNKLAHEEIQFRREYEERMNRIKARDEAKKASIKFAAAAAAAAAASTGDDGELKLSDNDNDDDDDDKDNKEDEEIIKKMYYELIRKSKKGIGSFGKVKKFPAAYRPALAEPSERKKDLHGFIQKRTEAKYKIRDDIEDDDKGNESEVSSDSST